MRLKIEDCVHFVLTAKTRNAIVVVVQVLATTSVQLIGLAANAKASSYIWLIDKILYKPYRPMYNVHNYIDLKNVEPS